MSAGPHARFAPLTPALLDAAHAIEQSAHRYPWSRGNLAGALEAGYQAQCLLTEQDTLLGYFIAMKGVDEVHLLNLVVALPYQRQGWAALMLEALALWSRGQGAQKLWLEVRASNARAQQVYLRHGFCRIGVRRGYYPCGHGSREDAVVMSLDL
ncbi:MAG: ribosomal protein S18-alanine N-acetyltransferase [Burkholderiaceae bacterium]|jgi:ribosomal-protein-alanine N-acetyltransferase|nr:ribosomal protein S18-alanine N-acetyltransferase [Burkholderiaceae bacterium]